MKSLRLAGGFLFSFALSAAAGAGTVASAQSARPIGAAGIESFRSLDFEAAIRSLRVLLASADGSRLGDSVHAELLTYIGAAEFLLGRHTEAARTFRSALEHAPDGRPDTLVFPPAITTAFDEARRGTALVVARPVGPSAFVAGRGRVEFRLEASAPHVVRASIQDPRGGVVRTLFDGPITDSLWISWDGLVTSGAVATAGLVDLSVTSIDADGIVRTLRLPLEVERLDPPSAPPAGIERRAEPSVTMAVRGDTPAVSAAHRPRWPHVFTGVIAAVAVVALPDAMSASPDPSPRRFIVGGVLATASLFAFRGAGKLPPQPDPGVRPPARPDPAAATHGMPTPSSNDASARLRISPLATRARSQR